MPTIDFISVNTEIISKIEKHIDKLISHNQKLDERNKKLAEDISKLNTTISQKEEELINLKKQNEVLSVAKSLSGESESTREVKLKINELVREIDRCIALLNN